MCNKRKKKGAKRIAMLVILLVAFALTVSSVHAESMGRFSQYQNCKSYVCTNADLRLYGSTTISTATIIPRYCRILGYSILPKDTTKSFELVVGLYDEETCYVEANIIDEAEMGATNDRQPRYFPYPMEVATGLSVWQGPNTVVIIYYEDKREI